MEATILTVDSFQPIFVARQTIYDGQRRPWGYKLFFRGSLDAQSADIDDPDRATANVIADGFYLAQQGIEPGKKILFNIPNGLLRKSMAQAFPPQRVIPQLDKSSNPDAAITAAAQQLKDAGYPVAVSLPCYDSLLKLADVIILDILGRKEGDVAAVVQKLKRYPGILLAMKIEEQKQFNLARALGFRLFQGYYFSKPVLLPGRKISPAASARLKLIQELSSSDFDLASLAATISSDPSLSFRLLKFINSIAFSLPNKIRSIQQAIALIGQHQLRQWLMAVTLSDLDTKIASEDHYFTSIQRARFLELLAECMPDPPFSKETMSLIGLFSMLDVLLGQTMLEILEQFPLEDNVVRTLTREDPETSQWLTLAESVENGRWNEVDALLARHGLSLTQAAVSYNMSMIWANEVMGSAA